MVTEPATLVPHCTIMEQAAQELRMPKGLYRDKTGWVVVERGRHQTTIPRNAYETNGYEPRYELLPTEADYSAPESEK